MWRSLPIHSDGVTGSGARPPSPRRFPLLRLSTGIPPRGPTFVRRVSWRAVTSGAPGEVTPMPWQIWGGPTQSFQRVAHRSRHLWTRFGVDRLARAARPPGLPPGSASPAGRRSFASGEDFVRYRARRDHRYGPAHDSRAARRGSRPCLNHPCLVEAERLRSPAREQHRRSSRAFSFRRDPGRPTACPVAVCGRIGHDAVEPPAGGPSALISRPWLVRRGERSPRRRLRSTAPGHRRGTEQQGSSIRWDPPPRLGPARPPAGCRFLPRQR